MLRQKITVSVPGKIHLMGEHAVVYGKPALLTAINRRLFCTISPAGKREVNVSEGKELIEKAIRIVQKHFRVKKMPPFKLEITSEIPIGRHAGSSAALAVGVVSALTFYLKKIWNKDLFNELAYEVEKLQHGNPSGGDNTAVTYGGLIWYRRELPFLKSLWQLPFKISKNLSFRLIDTGRPVENTGEMVALVSEFTKKEPQKAKELFIANEEATRELTVALKEKNSKLIVKTIRKGEKTLEGMGVVSQKVIPLIREIEEKGGAGKILGGGGRIGPVGLILIYHENTEFVKHLAEKYGYIIYNIRLGEEGVRIE